MKYKIPLIKNPFFNKKIVQKKLARFILSSDIYSMNKHCYGFEKIFSRFQGRKHTVLFNSGSSANLALIQALINLKKLKKDDVVGFSSIGWPTTIMPLIQLGLKTIPIDIDLRYLNVSMRTLENTVNKLKAQYGKKLRALFYTNILGATGDIDIVKKYCQDNNIFLLEDNCESLGSEFNHIKLGNFGLASSFSFFVGHHLSCIEGGAVCTDDDELADMLIMVRAHGWDRNLNAARQKKLRNKFSIDDFNAKYTFYTIGMNLRPTEITGFLGLAQSKWLKDIIQRRENNFKFFYKAIAGKFNKVFNIYQNDRLTVNSNFAFAIVFKNKKDFLRTRNIFIKKGLEVRPIIGGDLTNQPFYRNAKAFHIATPNTKLICGQGFYFGNNPDLTRKEVKLITELIQKI